MVNNLLTPDVQPGVVTQLSTDVVWRSSTGENQVWQLSNGQRSRTQSLAALDATWKVAGISDFNRDRQSDLLWRNSQSGEMQIWQRDGTAMQQIALPSQGLDWQVVGIGDFDGDRNSDIVWRNDRTGENKIGYLNGATYRSERAFLRIEDGNWQIVQVGDFDGDGQSDLFWHNRHTGQTALWIMRQGEHSQGTFLPTVGNLAWEVTGLRDINRDGSLDVLWHNGTTGQTLYWQFNRSQYQSMVSLPTTAPHWRMVSATDLNADGSTDFLWQSADGDLIQWLMDGSTLTSSTNLGSQANANAIGVLQTAYTSPTAGLVDGASPLSPTVPMVVWRSNSGENQSWQLNNGQRGSTQPLPSLNVNWQIAGLADFNRDGQGDVLWRNLQTGAMQIWQMNGTAVQSIVLPERGLDWQICAIGDFDGDRNSDLVWRNSRTGEGAVWFLDGTRYRSEQAFYRVADLDWQIVGAADFDADGQSDLIWYNRRAGQVALWLMRQGVYTAQGGFWNIEAGSDWQVVGVQDLNRDGSPDLLWRNSSSGQTLYWQFNRSQFQALVSLPSTPLDWRLISSADLNNDGYADLLWQNATGELTQWLMDGRTVTSSASLGGQDGSQWTAVGLLQTDNALQSVTVATPSSASLLNGFPAKQESSPIFSSTGRVLPNKLSEFYRFSTPSSGVFSAQLSGLSADADVRLIQDANGNGAIDAGEVLAWQWERGTTSESIRRFLEAGTYYVEVKSYNNQSANYTLSTSFSTAASDPDGFRINVIFADSLTGLSQSARDAIQRAAQFWQSAIAGKSRITRTNELNITFTGASLVNSDGSADTGTLALSGPSVGLDNEDRMVLTRGSSTLNSRKFGEFNANPSYLEAIMRHEIVHILGFGTIWEPVQFQTADGTVVNSRDRSWIDRTASTYVANSYAGYAYGELLGTYQPTAVPIEPQVFAHWDEGRFDSELMTPYAEGIGGATPLSILTLAALRDLGWQVNFGVAEAYALPQSQATPQAV